MMNAPDSNRSPLLLLTGSTGTGRLYARANCGLQEGQKDSMESVPVHGQGPRFLSSRMTPQCSLKHCGSIWKRKNIGNDKTAEGQAENRREKVWCANFRLNRKSNRGEEGTMKTSRITIIAGLAALCLLPLSLPVGANGNYELI
jgi:hypothetical protein